MFGISGGGGVSEDDIENFYNKEQEICNKDLVLSELQKKKVRQRNIESLKEAITGIKRRFAIVRIYDCIGEDWVVKNEGCLFLVETWDNAYLILMNMKKRSEEWRASLTTENEIIINALNNHFAAFEGEEGLVGISFARLYDMNDFIVATKDLVSNKEEQVKKRKKKKKMGFFSSIWNAIAGDDGLSGLGFSIAPPQAPPIKRSTKPRPKPKPIVTKKKTPVVKFEELDPKWKEFLLTNTNITEEELKDPKNFRRIMSIVKPEMGSSEEDERKFDDEEDNAKSELGEEEKKKMRKVIQNLTKKIKALEEGHEKSDSIKKDKILQLSKELEIANKRIFPPKPTKKPPLPPEKKKKDEEFEEIEDDGEGPPQAPEIDGIEDFLKKKEDRIKENRERREKARKLLPPPKADSPAAFNMFNEIKKAMEKRKKEMEGKFEGDFMEDSSDDENESETDWDNQYEENWE